MKEQLFFATYLIFLTACFTSMLFKWKFRPEHMNDAEIRKLYPCRTKFIRLYLIQLAGIPYLWNIGDSSCLIYLNAILYIGFASILGYSSDIYYFGKRKTVKESLVYYLPFILVMSPLLFQAFSGLHFIPDWLALSAVSIVSLRYIFKEVVICMKIGRMITNVQKGMYSEISDFPFKQAKLIQWAPLTFTAIAFLIMIANNPWVNAVRDICLGYMSCVFMIHTLNTKRKIESNYFVSKGEQIGKVSVKRTMSDRKYEELKAALEKVMKEDRIYLDQHLDMTKLQQAVGSNRNYIYEVIGRSGQGSFYEMVNRNRVEHAKDLIRSNPDMMLADIAEASGFCSPSAFSKAFKTYTGTTPSRYASQVMEK